MSDTTPLSNLVSVTNRTVNAGDVLDPDAQNTQEADADARIAALNSAIRDEASNRAGTSAPADNAVEGQIWFDSTLDPGVWKGDPDGSGADSEFHNAARWPVFRANKGGLNQDNITGIELVNWGTEVFDSGDFSKPGNPDAFFPSAAGKYLLTAMITWRTTSVTAGDALRLFIYEGASAIADVVNVFDGTVATSVSFLSQTVSIIVDADGSSDVYTVRAENNDRNTSDLEGTAVNGYFCGSRIA